MDEIIKAKIMTNYTNSPLHEIDEFIYELQQENMISSHETIDLLDWTKEYVNARLNSAS